MSFLSGLKSRFSPDKDINDIKTNNPNFIVKPSRILQVLKSVLESHVHITVIFPDNTEHASRLLDVKSSSITIDQLNNRAAHTKILASSEVKIHAKHGKVPCNFTAQILPSNQSGAYSISVPDKIYHPQKRNFVRINLLELDKYQFSATPQFTDKMLDGYLYDISAGGICLSTYSTAYIKKGAVLSQVTLKFKDNITIHCDLDVCSVRKSSHNGSTLIGCVFNNISNKEKKLVNKFINESARESKKKHSLFSKD